MLWKLIGLVFIRFMVANSVVVVDQRTMRNSENCGGVSHYTKVVAAELM